MSSILKALKKLENEVSVKGDIDPSRHQSHAKTSKIPAFGDPPVKKRLSIVLSALTLLVGSGLILTFKPWGKQPASTVVTGLDADIAPVFRTATKTPAVTQKKTTPIKKVVKQTPMADAAKDAATAAREIEKEAAERFVKTAANKAKPSDGFQQEPASVQPIDTRRSTGDKEQLSYQMADNTPYATIPVKSSSESMLELQAIAWFGHPEKRMVVINGHIVREGDVVKGATVKQIGKNEVVFFKSGEQWRQVFRSAARF